MNTIVAAVVSSALAFAVTFGLVPRRRPDLVPPSWFELPGTPLAIDGQPVSDWQQANHVLRGVAHDTYYQVATDIAHLRAAPPEVEAREIRVTWRRHAGARSDGGPAVESTVVRTFVPTTLEFSRANPSQLVRYEIVSAAVD